jgi:hypothetical protein
VLRSDYLVLQPSAWLRYVIITNRGFGRGAVLLSAQLFGADFPLHQTTLFLLAPSCRAAVGAAFPLHPKTLGLYWF